MQEPGARGDSPRTKGAPGWNGNWLVSERQKRGRQRQRQGPDGEGAGGSEVVRETTGGLVAFVDWA